MVDRVEQHRRGHSSQRKSGSTHPYAAIDHRIIDSPAFADMSSSSVRLLLVMTRQLTKDNNGQLNAAFKFCQSRGFGSEHTLRDAIADLIAHGFIYRTRSHGANGAWARYAVTWLPIKSRDGLFLDGFKPFAWRDWTPTEKKSTRQKVPDQSSRKCSFNTKKPAESAGSRGAETADYESCCHGSSELQPIGNDSPSRFSVPPNLGDWIPEYLKRLTARGLAGACPVAIPPHVIH